MFFEFYCLLLNWFYTTSLSVAILCKQLFFQINLFFQRSADVKEFDRHEVISAKQIRTNLLNLFLKFNLSLNLKNANYSKLLFFCSRKIPSFCINRPIKVKPCFTEFPKPNKQGIFSTEPSKNSIFMFAPQKPSPRSLQYQMWPFRTSTHQPPPTLRNRFRFMPRSATTTEQIFALIFLARAVSSDELHALRFLRPPARRLHEDGFSGSVPPTPGNGKTSKTVRKEPWAIFLVDVPILGLGVPVLDLLRFKFTVSK